MLHKLFIVIFLVAPIWSMRQQRDIFDDAERFLDHLNTGIDHFQVQARNDFSRLKPFAERIEEQVKPAMEHMEKTLGNAFNSMADQVRLPSSKLYNCKFAGIA